MKLSFFLIAFSRAQNDSTERAIAEDDQCRRNGEDVPCDAQMSARSGDFWKVNFEILDSTLIVPYL